MRLPSARARWAPVGLVDVFGAARATSTPIRRFSPHFLVLGVAFLLLETKSLVSFSLLFGTTWLVNAMSFFAILASVLLAIAVNARFRPSSPARLPACEAVAVAIGSRSRAASRRGYRLAGALPRGLSTTPIEAIYGLGHRRAPSAVGAAV